MDNEILKSIVQYFGAGGVLLMFVAAAAKGFLSWKSERSSQTPNEIYNQQLETFQQIAHAANVRADMFAAERNDLLVKVTRVEGELARLNDVVIQNDRLRVVVDQKDIAIKKMIADHNDTVHKMLAMLDTKSDLLMAQQNAITLLEVAVRNMQVEHVPGSTTTTITKW